MKIRIVWFICVLGVGLTPVSGLAGHHSFAGQFDPSMTMELEGDIVRIQWINPHAYLTVETDDGVAWELETAGAIQLSRSGVDREFFNVGDRVRAAGWPPVTQAREMHATNMLLPDGRELILARNARAQLVRKKK